MTNGALHSLLPLLVVFAIVVAQYVRTVRRRFRAVAAERRIAQQPVSAARATAAALPKPVAPPAARTTQPMARMPKRVEPDPAVAPRATSPPATLLPAAGPRWAANAVVAAEVFGPPLALRPDGTLGSPQAF
jgi:hypothetical protein